MGGGREGPSAELPKLSATRADARLQESPVVATGSYVG
jgi:hypothetical protein